MGACALSRIGRVVAALPPSGYGRAHPAEPMTDEEAEFHGPDWVLGQTTMVEMPRWLPGGSPDVRAARLLVAHHRPAGAPEGALPAVRLHQPRCAAHGDGVAYIGGPADGPDDVWVLPSTGQAARPASDPVGRFALAPRQRVGGGVVRFGRALGASVHGVLYPPKLAETGGRKALSPL